MKKPTITIKAKVYKPAKRSYDKTQLAKGKKIESEHTPTPKLQAVIAKNHLDEDPNYYKKLSKVERKSKPKTKRAK